MKHTAFTHNLLQLSESKDPNDHLKEWFVVAIGENKDPSKEEIRCICNKNIKHYYIVRNVCNMNNVKMGSGCINKLNQNAKHKIKHDLDQMKKNVIKLFDDNHYVQITNLDEYAKRILIEHVKKQDIFYVIKCVFMYKNNQSIYDELVGVYDDMYKGINDDDLLHKINHFRNEFIQKELEDIKLIREKEEKERIEKAKLQKRHELIRQKVEKKKILDKIKMEKQKEQEKYEEYEKKQEERLREHKILTSKNVCL